jgi:regulator of protease activity HflC (stomatin/prohibitin superfamily)
MGNLTNRAMQEELTMRKIRNWVMGAILFLICMIAGCGSCYTVQSGERALVFTWGEVTSIKSEGLQFKMPIMQSVEKVDIRIQKVEAPADAASKDLQTVSTTVALNYSLDPSRLKELYSTVGLDVESRVIATRVQETVKAVAAKYTAEELITQREAVRQEIARSITSQLQEYHLTVAAGGVQITNFDFSKSFNDAIEEKQVAEQKALTAKNNLERIKVEAEQRISQARGEAEAIRIQAEAIKAQGGKEYVNLKAIEKWDGKLPQYTGSGPIPFLDIK